MKFNKIFLIFTLLLTNFTTFVDAKVSVNKIKDLVNVLNPEYENLSPVMMWESDYALKYEKSEHFSPIFGALLWESDYIKNFYQFAPEFEAKKLVKEMFYLQPDGITFVVTTNPLKIAHYFTPEIVGEIIGFTTEFLSNIQKQKNQNYAPLQKKLQTILEPLIFDYKKEKKSKQKTIKQSALTKINTFYDRIEERFLEEIKEIKKKRKIYKEDQAKIDKIQTSIKANQKVKNNPEPLMTENINLFIKHFVAAIKEEQIKDILIPQNHSTFILLSLLWSIVDKKQDFLNYFLSLQNQIQKSIFKEEYNLQRKDMQAKFLNSEYSATDYVTFYDNPNVNDFEKGCLLFLGFSTYKAVLPPNISYKGEVVYKNLSFPDCGETSLLNFFNAIIYDSETKNFDISILEKLEAAKRLINFYKEHSTVEKMANTVELHNDWANVVCGLPNVKYSNQKICDITPGLENNGIGNILNVLEELLHGLKKKESSNILEQLAKALEQDGIKLTISMPSEYEKPQQTIRLTCSKGNNRFILTWIFLLGHFILEFPKNTYGKTFQHKIKAKVKKEELSDYNLTKYFILTRAFVPITTFYADFFDTKKQLILYDLLIQKLDSNSTLNTMTQILNFKSIDINYKKQFLFNLYTALPQTDNFAQIRAFNIFNSIMQFEEYADKLSYEGKRGIAQNILSQKIINQFPIVEKIFAKLKSPNKTDIIISILKKGSLEQNQKDFETLYKKIESLLYNSKNKYFAPNCISRILDLFSASQKKGPNTQNIKNITPHIYGWIKNVISKMKLPKKKLIIFYEIIRINPNLMDAEFLKYLQNWAKESLGEIKAPGNIIGIIYTIKNLDPDEIKNCDQNFLNFICKWIKETLSTITIQEKAHSVINELIWVSKIKNQEILDAIYKCLSKNLPLVTNEQEQIKSLKAIFYDDYSVDDMKQIDKQVLDLIQKWVKDVLPKIKNEILNKKFKKWQEKINEAQGNKKEKLKETLESEEDSSDSSSGSSSGSSSSSESFSSEEEEELF